MAIYATDHLVAYYSGPLGSHRMGFWKRSTNTDAQFIAAVRSVIGEFVAAQYADVSWHSATYQEAGQDFSTAIGWTPINSSSESADPGPSETVGEYLNFAARSVTTGVRTRLFLFEQGFGPLRQMRLTAAASATINDILVALSTESENIGAPDGSPVVWKAYANLGINDFWIKRARNG